MATSRSFARAGAALLMLSSALVNASTVMVGPPVRREAGQIMFEPILPREAVQKRLAPSYDGCYSSSQGLTEYQQYEFQSSGWCTEHCMQSNSAVIGLTGGGDCWCGNEIPPTSAKVADSNCNTKCDGYGDEMCGGTGYWTVYLTGLEYQVQHVGGGFDTSSSSSTSPSSSSSSSSTQDSTSTSPQVVTSIAPGQTVVVTQAAAAAAQSSSNSSKGGSSPNVAGIAAGVVVGIVGVSALCGGLFFFLRRRRQRAAEEEYRRKQQVSEFMHGGERKAPGSSWSNLSDSRMDVAGRRTSNGSLADAQDYSRRILRVANPDRS